MACWATTGVRVRGIIQCMCAVLLKATCSSITMHNVLCLRDIQPILEVLSEHHLPAGVLTVAVQLAASLILVSPNVPECHAHLSPLLKAVCDRGRTNDREEIGIVLAFFQELALKYPGYEYVRSTSVCVCQAVCMCYLHVRMTSFLAVSDGQ